MRLSAPDGPAIIAFPQKRGSRSTAARKAAARIKLVTRLPLTPRNEPKHTQRIHRVAVAFAAKLRMAAAALGYTSRKELCVRFRAVNPATQCDLDRLNKWVQGRALPRAASVYADFAGVIGTAKPPSWVADCALEEFAAELAALTGADAATLASPDSLSPRASPRVAGLLGGIETLAGAFAAYSPAWSPHFHGQLVRGAWRLAAGRSGGLIAAYTEHLVGRELRLTGTAQISGRSIHVTVSDADGDMPPFISVAMPGPPASVLCGVMSGVAFLSHESLPSACRIVFVRVPETARLDATNRYFDPVPGAIAADLADLGMNLPEADRFDTVTRAFLGAWPNQVASQDQAAFASMLDRAHLHADDRPTAPPEPAEQTARRRA
jgi:hypothetical protein